MPKVYFDERIAALYDATASHMYDPSVLGPTVDLLADLAGDGAALEFAIGTGRVALPLHARGVRVAGIDLSDAMVSHLRAKANAGEIDVTIGDIASTRADGTFRLVYLVFNTITNLLTQDAQVECFRNAAAHLEPGGCFLIEVGVPDLRRLPPGERTRVFTTTPSYIGFDEYTDVPGQILYSHHWWTQDGKVEIFSAPYRYVFPSELDLMARLTGLSLQSRWGGWNREPFTADSTSHVSVWAKP